jgi:hypothetical protein
MTERPIEVTDLQAVTPHNAAIYEAGKALLVDSVDVGRDFCKSMIPLVTGSVAAYLALLGLAVGKDYRPTTGIGILLMIPVLGFLASACVFAWGYFPKTSAISLESVDETEATRSEIINRRRWLAAIAFGIFILALVGAISAAVYGFTVDVPVTQSRPT